MSFDRGNSPAGVTGLLDIVGNPQYQLYVFAFDRGLTIPTIQRPGRNLPRWAAFRRLDVGSTITFRANITSLPNAVGGFPTPVVVENSTGSITLQFDTGKTVTFTGDVVGYAEKLNEKTKDNWEITVSVKISVRPVYVGFGGTQSAPSTQTFADQQTDEGLNKVLDPVGLRTTAVQRIDVGTIADTDAAEVAKIQTYVASALATTSAPIPTLIPRTGQLVRTDRAGVAVSVEWGKRSTSDDVTYPESVSHIDPYLLDSFAVSAVTYHLSAGPPALPTPPAGLQAVSVERVKLDRTIGKQKVDMAVTNSVQKVLIAGTESTRSVIQADRDSVMSMYNSTATDMVFASATYLSLQPVTPNLVNIVVKSQDPYRKKLTQNLINPGIQVLSISHGGARLVEYMTSGSTVLVNVLTNQAFGSGGWRKVQLTRQNVLNKPIRHFILTRMRFLPPPIPEYPTQFGTTNNASFLGLATGTCKYNSCSDSTKLLTPPPSNQAFFLGYHFEADALGFIQQIPEVFFRQPIYCNTTVTAIGWVNAATLNLPLQSPLAVAVQSDFSPFIASP